MVVPVQEVEMVGQGYQVFLGELLVLTVVVVEAEVVITMEVSK